MTKVIIVSGSSLEDFYYRTLDYLHDKYHSYPKHDEKPVTFEEKHTMGLLDSHGRGLSRGASPADAHSFNDAGEITGNKVW